MKILIIGLDGTTWDVFTDDVLAEWMPRLKGLRDSGCWGVLDSTIPALTPAAWTTCTSGVLPHNHELMDFQKYRFEKDSFEISTASDVKTPSMWHYLGDEGYRVASINVPFTYPTYPINGVMISGLGCPGTGCEFTYPPEFKAKLLESVPDYGIALGPEGLNKRNKGMGQSQEDFKRSLSRLARRFEHRMEAARLIQKDNPVDVMMVQFQQLDLLQHLCWPYVSAETRDKHPWYRDEIFKLYQRLDVIIGELLDMVDRETGLVGVVSDHGFGPTPYYVSPNKNLTEWGYIRRANSWQRFLRRTRRNLMQMHIGDTREMTIEMKQPINWSKTKAMVLLRPLYGAVYLNVQGRQPNGCVTPGQEYSTIIQDIKRQFAEITNPFNGEKVYEQVVTPTELWGVEGDAANEIFGDLLLIQKQTYRMSKSMKPGNSEVGESPVGSLSASWHYTEGMFIWQGKGIGVNRRFDSHIANIAPSLYAWLGIPIPAEVDGEPMLEMFRVPPEVDYRDVINYPNAFGKGKPSIPEERSAEEQEALQDQLKSLGYL